jgi:protein-S-isoprenylcysteine O-methyltransferase Ste14
VEDAVLHPIDTLIYPLHAAFWATFGLTRWLTHRSTSEPATDAADGPAVQAQATAPFSRGVLAAHVLAFAAMYMGVGEAVFGGRVPEWFAGQRIASVLVTALGAALMSWAVAHFQSWRFRAKLDAGHRLATDGPFRFLRHPIYMGLNCLALGTAIWIPTPTVWIGVVLMVLGSDLRARSEEHLLRSAFGRAYADYCTRTSRFVPGVY